MIWFLLIGIIVLVSVTFLITYWWEDDFLTIGIFLSLIVIAAGWGLFQLIGHHNTRTAQEHGNQVIVWERERELRALNTGSAALSGRAFLTVGYVDGNRVYSYIYETEDGGFIVDTESLGRAMVYEVDGLTEPYMREVRSRGSWWWTWTAVRERTEFYVPKGSVMDESYDVSIEGKVG